MRSVTTAASWRPHAGEAKTRPPRTLNVAFTYAGLGALGLAPAALRTFPDEFRLGMAAETRSRILGDTGASAPAQWELGGPQNEPIHALLILNAQTEADLAAWCDEQRQAAAGGRGRRRRARQAAPSTAHGPPSGTEQFGFFDGVAQPQIEGIKGKGVRTGEFIFGYQNEYGFFPVSPVVPPADDPRRILPASANPFHQAAGYRDFGSNGTFVVYRKLAQDVAAFWRFLQAESLRLKGAVDPAVYGLAGGKDGGALAERRAADPGARQGPARAAFGRFSVCRERSQWPAVPVWLAHPADKPARSDWPHAVRPNRCT